MRDEVKIGVTGHRFLVEVERLNASVTKALHLVRAAFPAHRYIVCSSLAEGADQLVASAAMSQLAASLEVILPQPRSEYLQAFNSEESKAQFARLMDVATTVVQLTRTEQGSNPFAGLAEYTVARCDVLIALWDGNPAQGAGGVGDVVQIARGAEKPLVIVATGNRVQGTFTGTSLGDKQGEISAERLPCSWPTF